MSAIFQGELKGDVPAILIKNKWARNRYVRGYPWPLSQFELGGSGIGSAFGSFRTDSCFLCGYFHLLKLPSRDTSIDGGSEEGKHRSASGNRLYGEMVFVAGALLMSYCFWYLQFRVENPRSLLVFLPLLVLGFLLVAYGTYLFLHSQKTRTDGLIQRSQLSKHALGNQNELGVFGHDLICGIPDQSP